MSRHRVLALGSVLLMACGSESQRPHVLLVTVDTLRPDHLSLYGYERPTSPELERWFGEGLVFERAYTTEGATSPSVVSILTGLLPQHHRVRLFYQLLPEETRTLADRLGAAGYQTAAVVSNVVLTDEAIGLGRRFDHYDDFVDEREPLRPVWERRAAPTTDAALAWLREERDPDRPVFLWVHYIDPHGPYDPPEDKPLDLEHEGEQPFDRRKMLAYQVTGGSDDALEYLDLYDEEIAYCDRELGRLFEGWARLTGGAPTVMAFTADHGETMIEHEVWFTHQYHVYEGIAAVPLALRLPDGRSARVSTPVSIVDLTPTLLEAVGLRVPQELDGRSLLQEGTSRVYVEASGFSGRYQHRALIQGETKWVVRLATDTGKLVSRWRIDLSADPGETEQLPWRDEDVQAAAWLLELASSDPDPAGIPRVYSKGSRIDGPKIRPGLDEEQLEKLRAMGYAK